MNQKITVNPHGPWQLYCPVLPAGSRPLGTVTRGAGDVGALVQMGATGIYTQANAGAFRSLPQREVASALAVAALERP